jgi:ectoine hydroxylase-related dioxygenase (phytanoyl-CoA dioxygenase family)
MTAALGDSYRKNGYLVVPNLFTAAEIGEFKAETTRLFRGERGPVEGLLDVTPQMTDAEVLRQYLAIHFPHRLSPVIERSLAHPGIVEVLTKIIGPNIKCMQSMLFVKGPGKPGQSWHQDEYYIPTRDRSLGAAWIALDDATVENGCLWVIPGSHQGGVILRRIPGRDAEYAEADTLDLSDIGERRCVPVEVKAGSVVFFHDYVVHSSRRTRTHDCFRMALVNHYMSAESLLPWDQDGKLPATADLRDIIMVAGTDPYAWKGLVSVNRPYLRAEVPDARVDC